MTHDEIIKRMQYTREKRGLTYMQISIKTGISYPTVRNAFVGENLKLYNFIDIMDVLGLEINLI